MAFSSGPSCPQNTQNHPGASTVGVPAASFEDIEYGFGGPEKLLADLRAAGVVLSIEGDRLAFDAPEGVLTDELLARMRAHREELLGLIRAPAGDPVAAAPGLRPVVVHLKRDRFDVRIDRRSKWGNRFKIGPDGDRAEVIEKYRSWILGRSDLMAALPELSGRRLGCWCAPLPCHGDVLADLVEQLTPAGLMGSAAPSVLADPAPGGSSVLSSIVCPWCRSVDLIEDPDGLRCGVCDRLAWLDLPEGGWERADRAELDLVEIDPDSVPVCPGCGRLCDVDRGPMGWGAEDPGDHSPGDRHAKVCLKNGGIGSLLWACSRCDPEADRRRAVTARWAAAKNRSRRRAR